MFHCATPGETGAVTKYITRTERKPREKPTPHTRRTRRLHQQPRYRPSNAWQATAGGNPAAGSRCRTNAKQTWKRHQQRTPENDRTPRTDHHYRNHYNKNRTNHNHSPPFWTRRSTAAPSMGGTSSQSSSQRSDNGQRAAAADTFKPSKSSTSIHNDHDRIGTLLQRIPYAFDSVTSKEHFKGVVSRAAVAAFLGMQSEGFGITPTDVMKRRCRQLRRYPGLVVQNFSRGRLSAYLKEKLSPTAEWFCFRAATRLSMLYSRCAALLDGNFSNLASLPLPMLLRFPLSDRRKWDQALQEARERHADLQLKEESTTLNTAEQFDMERARLFELAYQAEKANRMKTSR